jgi:hypothetical protein
VQAPDFYHGRGLLVCDFVLIAKVAPRPQVAIYTEHWEHVSLLRKILLRMRGWENYVFLEGH